MNDPLYTPMPPRSGGRRLLLPLALVLIAGVSGATYFYMTRNNATPEERIAHARQLEQTGDIKGAAIELKNALQAQPGNADARFLLGRLHFVNNDFANAEKELRQAISRGYRGPEATIMLARSLLLQRHPEKVLDEIKPVDTQPVETRASILALRAQAYAMSDNKEEMEKNLQEASALVPEHPDVLAVQAGQAFAAGQNDVALALVEKAVTKAPARADLIVMQADLLRLLQRSDEAIVSYKKAVGIEPANVAARLAVVQLYMSGGKLNEASAELKALHGYAPNNLIARYFEAVIDFRNKNLDAAGQKLEEVLRGVPNFGPANLLAGAINLSQGKRELAVTRLNRALETSPDHPLARKLLASAMLESGRDDDAQKLIEGLSTDEGDVQLLALRGNIALRKGNFQEAKKELEKAAALAPENTALMRELAASRLASGDESGAIETLTKLAEKDSDKHQADVVLVMTHLQAKRYAESLKVVDELARRNPRLPLAENLRGAIYLAQKNTALAKQSFLKALEFDPAYLPAASNLARLDLADKNIQAARARFEGIIKAQPRTARAHVALAELAALERKEDQYLQHLARAKEADPKDATSRRLLSRYWLAKRDAIKAMTEARSGLDATGDAAFHGLIGGAYALQGDTANSQVAFAKWAEGAPRNPLAHYQLALAQLLSRNQPDALKSLNKALALRPDFIDAGMSKAFLLGQMGQMAEGYRIARELQTKAPQNGAGYFAEAQLQSQEKKYDAAARAFTKAAELSGRGQAVVSAFAAYSAAGQAAEGEKALRAWLQTKPADRVVRHQLAVHLLNTKRFKDAELHYLTLTKDNPKDAVAYNNLAWVRGELGTPDAVTTAQTALNLTPGNAATLDTLGWNLVRAGKAQSGLEHIRQALAVAPDTAEILWHQAVALAKIGEPGRARQELQVLLNSGKRFPQEAEARQFMETLK